MFAFVGFKCCLAVFVVLLQGQRPGGLVNEEFNADQLPKSQPGLTLFSLSQLTERKVPPSFTKRPSESMMDSVGKTVKMEGRVSGSQPLEVTWYKDDREVYGSDNYDVSFMDNVAVLSIRTSSCSDGGVYTCKASNEAGEAFCRVSLSISGMSGGLFFFSNANNMAHMQKLEKLLSPGFDKS